MINPHVLEIAIQPSGNSYYDKCTHSSVFREWLTFRAPARAAAPSSAMALCLRLEGGITVYEMR